VIGGVISGVVVGAMVGGSAKVVFDDVLVSGNGEFGVFVGGVAELEVRDSMIYDNSAAGIGAVEDSKVTITGSELYGNHPAIEASGAASVTITGSDLHDNGTGIPGGQNSAVSVMESVRLAVTDTLLRDNAYAGIHLRGAVDVTVGPGTDINGNFIGVAADAFLGGEASIDFDGALVQGSVDHGVWWAIPMG